MRFSSFSLLSLLPLLIGALPFDNNLGSEPGTNSYQRQDRGLFNGPRKYISADVGDSKQLIPFVIWLPQSTLLRSSPRYRRGDSGHDSDVCGDPGHGSEDSGDPSHGSDGSDDSGHSSDSSDDSGHGSDGSGDPGHDQSDDNEGLVPLSTGVIDQSDLTALSGDADPSDNPGSDSDDDTDSGDTDTDPSDDVL